MEDKVKIIKRLEDAYKETRLDIVKLVYYTTSEDGKGITGEYVDVFVKSKSSPWMSVNVYADSGAAMIYDVVNAIFKRM